MTCTVKDRDVVTHDAFGTGLRYDPCGAPAYGILTYRIRGSVPRSAVMCEDHVDRILRHPVVDGIDLRPCA